jgi:hypothetical protein
VLLASSNNENNKAFPECRIIDQVSFVFRQGKLFNLERETNMDRENFEYPAFTLDFADQSKCTYIEILQYAGLVDPLITEGSLDEEALPSWLSKVPLLYSFPTN